MAKKKQAQKAAPGNIQAKKKSPVSPGQLSFFSVIFAVFSAPVR
jgi:hypothetical protein